MYTYNCIINKIVDGDTIDVDLDLGFDIILKNQRVRLHGVDTPETRTKDLVEKQFGLLATEYVNTLLTVGEKYVLVSKEYNASGKFGRLLADFEVHDKSINYTVSLTSLLIKNGYGAEYHINNLSLTKQLHLANRRMLIENGVVTNLTLAEAGVI